MLLALNVLAFAAATAVVWAAGTRMVLFSDEIAERFDLGRAFIGLILLATITSLPEVVTTFTASAAGNAGLALGNLFGGITMQTAILAAVDFMVVRHALTSWPRKPTHALEAVFLIVLLTVLVGISIVGERELFWQIGAGGLCLFLAYPLVITTLRRYDERQTWAPIDFPESETGPPLVTSRAAMARISNTALMLRLGITSLLILVAGYFAADRADQIARLSGLGSSFIGLALLAAATSTPEVSTTFAAARMGNYTMAISNIFGSNLIMIALIFPADAVYRAGAILDNLTPGLMISIVSGILVTAIYVAGLLIRRTPRVLGGGLDSAFVLAIYIASLVAAYALNDPAP